MSELTDSMETASRTTLKAMVLSISVDSATTVDTPTFKVVVTQTGKNPVTFYTAKLSNELPAYLEEFTGAITGGW